MQQENYLSIKWRKINGIFRNYTPHVFVGCFIVFAYSHFRLIYLSDLAALRFFFFCSSKTKQIACISCEMIKIHATIRWKCA